MNTLSPLMVSKPMAIALTASAVLVAFLFAANVSATNAQEQQQQLVNSSGPAEPPQNGTLFQSEVDSFRVEVPEGWAIYDVNNTGSTLAAEATQGYGILAQLCPEGQQRERALANTSSSCLPEEEVIHVIRYPNIGPKIGIDAEDIRNLVPDSVLQYQMQKLQEAGYRNINVMNNTNTTMKVHYISNETAAQNVGLPDAATVPARLVEVTYSSNSAPNETRRGEFLLTATNATPPGIETITGYSLFYEGGRASAAEEAETSRATSGSLTHQPAEVKEVFGSFELIPSEEVRNAILQNVLAQLMNDNQEDGGEDNNNSNG